MKKNKNFILICDDDEGIADVTKIILEDAGYAVESCTNGAEVLATIQKRLPALIFIDLWMPGINGDEITRQLKADPATAAIPIIIISANKDTTSISEAAGADGFLCKPFEIQDLENIAKKYMQ